MARTDTPHVKAHIICYDFDKNKDYTVAKIKVDDLAECNGKYLFYYKNIDQGGGQLWKLNLSSRKRRKIDDYIAYIKYGDGRYLLGPVSGDVSPTPIYIMKKNGTGKKKICKAIGANIYKKKVYYIKYCGNDKGKILAKVCSCDFNGKNKKNLTKKMYYNDIPEKYKKIICS